MDRRSKFNVFKLKMGFLDPEVDVARACAVAGDWKARPAFAQIRTKAGTRRPAVGLARMADAGSS
jgi:hypothetical protein